MDYAALRRDPLWEELWNSKEIRDKVELLQKNLMTGSITDAHTLGKMRGKLEGLLELKQLVDTMAEKQLADANIKPETQETRKERIANLRRFFVR